VWHYKCIRPILNGPQWPNFLCPNCRAVADLEADVDDPADFEQWDSAPEEANGKDGDSNNSSQEDRQITPRASAAPLVDTRSTQSTNASSTGATNGSPLSLHDLEAAFSGINLNAITAMAAASPAVAASASNSFTHNHSQPSTPPRLISPAASSSTTQPVSINVQSANEGLNPAFFTTSSDRLSPERTVDGPMTPRNDAGPFVLDGSGGSARGTPRRVNHVDGEQRSPSPGAPVLPPINM